VNIHNGRRAKIRKHKEKGKCRKKRKIEIIKVVREILGRPRMPNKGMEEFLRNDQTRMITHRKQNYY
jgi:hypothetical protein